MSTPGERKCPDCQDNMAPILLIDKTHVTGGHQAVEYALAGERWSPWTGRFPTEGTVSAFMCGGCGRIILYGMPKQE